MTIYNVSDTVEIVEIAEAEFPFVGTLWRQVYSRKQISASNPLMNTADLDDIGRRYPIKTIHAATPEYVLELLLK